MRVKEAVQQRVLELCRENCLSPTGLSTKCGMTPSTLHNITSGRNSSTVATIQKICDGLDMDLPTFFDSDLFRHVEQEIL